MQNPSSMLTRLNMETRGEHSLADAPWLDLMGLEVTRARYLGHLVAIYGYEAPIETALALTPRINMLLPLRERCRSGLIVQDLLALGMSPSSIARLPQCTVTVPFRDPAEALGWMYVVERATLLHDAVRRYLEGRLPGGTGTYEYLSAYQGVASTRWLELGRVLDEVAAASQAADLIVAATHTAFRCLRDWFSADHH